MSSVRNVSITRRSFVAGVAAVLAGISPFGALAEANPQVNDTAQRLAADTLEEFLALTKIPRPSGHLEKACAYLMGWARDHGFAPEHDNAPNMWFDVPASIGCEDWPAIILQGHMDMVVSVEEGKKFDPINDPIEAVVSEDGKHMHANGTSLGADDGIGVGLALAIAGSDYVKHGPLRILVTADEETGMAGAEGLDPTVVAGIEYLVNLDSEFVDQMTVSTAGGLCQNFSKTYPLEHVERQSFMELRIDGLTGGHSGLDMHEGLANAIELAFQFLGKAIAQGIPVAISSASAGIASNVIPTSLTMLLAVPNDDQGRMWELLDEVAATLSAYPGETGKPTFDLVPTNSLAEDCLSAQDTTALVDFALSLPNGILAWSDTIEGLVETSGNLAVLDIEDGALFMVEAMRSAITQNLVNAREAWPKRAAELGITSNEITFHPGWDGNPNNPLQLLANEAYEAVTGKDAPLIAVHAGLECSWFGYYNPTMSMVAIGPTLHDVHTPAETLDLDTVPVVAAQLAYMLEHASQLG